MTLAASDARKLLVVLRRTDGAPLEIVDSAGTVFAARLAVDGQSASARLDAPLAVAPPMRLRVTLAQGIPKGAKMDYVIEKATELGIARIVPFAGERTLGDGVRAGKIERWRRLAASAAAQCGRSDVAEVAEPLDFAGLTATFADFDRVVMPWELAPAVPLRDALPAALEGARNVLVAIGPEGGFSHAEAHAAQDAGARLVSLGPRILRTETAGLVVCAAAFYASGDL